MSIENNYLIEKRNVLNELRANNMSLQELRFFSIYLAKINARDIATRIVRFPLLDFQKIMQLGKLTIPYLKLTIDGLLCKIIHIPNINGGFTAIQLFKECSLTKNELGEWIVEIDAHDKALPLMFEFKEKYFSYQLWNALQLKSSNQLRMYELLKQYEKIGERILSIEELKSLLGILKEEYKRWDNFKKNVLEVCKKSLEKNTDIKFTYEPYTRGGKGHKILSLRFIISKNKNYKDPITLDQFINEQELADNSEFVETQEVSSVENNEVVNSAIRLYRTACDNEFSKEEISLLHSIIVNIVPYTGESMELVYFHYLREKYNELNMQASRRVIKYRFAYLKKIIEADLP